MPRSPVTTKIGEHQYRLTPLGPDAVASLGERAIEAAALAVRGVPGLAAVLADVRRAVQQSCETLVVDRHAPGQPAQWVALATMFDDRFGGAPKDYGKWYAWAVAESGIPAFLGGTLGEKLPTLLLRALSGLPKEPAGSSTDSSTPNASG